MPKTRRLWSKHDPTVVSRRSVLQIATGSASGDASYKTKTATKRGKAFELAYRDCLYINSALSDETDVSGAKVLKCNTEPQRVFQGVTPGHSGFVLSAAKAKKMLAQDPSSSQVVHPYLIGEEILTGSSCAKRYLIDFKKRSLIEAQGFRAAFKQVQEEVLPGLRLKAESNADSTKAALQYWWRLWRDRAEMRLALNQLHGRCVACSRVTKRPIFVFTSTEHSLGDRLQVFAMEDDYSFAILQSNAHWIWFVTKSSKLTERLIYTPASVFDTFPWPQAPTVAQIEAVAEAGREIRRIRAEALSYHSTSLRALYRTLELPGKNPLKAAHAALDAAVLSAYGFNPASDLLAQLLALNLQVATRIGQGQNVTSPGLPPTYPNPANLITPDCIQPPEL